MDPRGIGNRWSHVVAVLTALDSRSMPEARLLVACLCAEWCGTCRTYRPFFDQVVRDRADRVDAVWVDIEDHQEVVGDLDVENFPTLLIADGDRIVFYGTVLPHEQTLRRLVDHALAGDATEVHDATLAGLPTRVRDVMSR